MLHQIRFRELRVRELAACPDSPEGRAEADFPSIALRVSKPRTSFPHFQDRARTFRIRIVREAKWRTMWAAQTSPFDVFCYLLFAIASLVAMVWCVHYYSAAVPAALKRWSTDCGYRIVSNEVRTFLKGPFFFRIVPNAVVYRLEVEDKCGALRRGWVRVRKTPFWFLRCGVEVVWDPPRRETPEPDPPRQSLSKPRMWDNELD